MCGASALDDSNPQESISAVLSVESYDVLREIVNGNTIPLDDSERHAVYRKGIEELETLLGTADNPCETRAIELSITELQRRKPQPYDQQEMMDNRRKLAKLYPLLPCAEGQTGP